MRVVIDTNCFLAILPKISPFRPVFDAYRSGRFELAVSTDVLEEYEEVFGQKMTPTIATNVLELIDRQSNTIYTTIYYRWNLIRQDPDDNKFVDCAVAAGATLLVTNDKHFAEVANVQFPPLRYVSLQTFAALLTNQRFT